MFLNKIDIRSICTNILFITNNRMVEIDGKDQNRKYEREEQNNEQKHFDVINFFSSFRQYQVKEVILVVVVVPRLICLFIVTVPCDIYLDFFSVVIRKPLANIIFMIKRLFEPFFSFYFVFFVLVFNFYFSLEYLEWH